MSDLREPMLMIAIGAKGIGKTFTTEKTINQYVSGNPSQGIKPRRVLIFDVNNEFQSYKTIPLSQIKAFSNHPKIEVRRATMFKPNGKKMSLDEMQVVLDYILKNFSNGLLLIEDISRYVTDNLNRDIVGSIVTQRHSNSDIFLHVQSCGKAGQPKLVGNTNYIRLHKTLDSFSRHANKFDEHLEFLQICESLVNIMNIRLEKDKQYFYCYCDMQLHLCSGDFNEDDFKEAIRYYIEKNPNETIKRVLRETELDGKKKYNQATGIEFLVEKYFKEYYGN